MGGEDRVVRLDDGGAHHRCGVDRELELCLLSVVLRKSLKEQGSKTGTCTATKGVEDEETLEAGACICKLANAVERLVDELLTDGVVTSGIVVGGILLSGDEGLGMEERAVLSGADLVDNVGL